MFVSCHRTFEQRTAKYAEVGPLSENRAAVLDTRDGQTGPLWGYVDATGRLAIACRFAGAETFAEGRAAVKDPQSSLWGYVDTMGVVVIAPRYGRVGAFSEGLAWVESPDSLKGCVDRSGREVIACLYEQIGAPDARGWMLVRRGKKWGFLHESGRVVVPAVYDSIDAANSHGQIPVADADKWGLLSEGGEPITARIYDRIEAPNQYGLIRVVREGKQGLLDAQGKEVLPCAFDYISEFEGGFARTNRGGSLKSAGSTPPGGDATGAAITDDHANGLAGGEPEGGSWGLIDSLGHEMIVCDYAHLAHPSDGLSAFRTEQTANYGYLTTTGDVLITPRYAVAGPFADGVAVVSYNKVDFGVVDRAGREISAFRYKHIGRFGDGLAPFNTNPSGARFKGMAPRAGYLDIHGREVLPARWDDAARFSEMRAAVMRMGTNPDDFYEARWGYISTAGHLVIPYKYHEAHPFSCGLARVFIRGLGYGYIDRQGTEVVPCQFDQAEDYHDFRARVTRDGRTFTLDENGRTVNEQGQIVDE